jgi:DNA-binding response OmpR family regulator
MSSEIDDNARGGKVMLVGCDAKQILERRLQAAGCRVVKVNDNEEALCHVRHQVFDMTVLVCRGSLINVAETIFNLRDLNESMKIIILIDRSRKPTNRFFRQLIEHPIAGTQLLTRRQLHRQLQIAGQSAPPGAMT